MRRRMRVVVVCWLVAAWSAAREEPVGDVDLTWGVKIPMRDGLRLNATLYRPADQKQSLPVVFTMTPYISDSYHDRAMYFARNGFVFALVDVRGRGNSEGDFEPFAHDPEDGHDVVEWLASQPWCDGKVAMWGGSYAGYNQWATLKEGPPHLATIVPAAAAHAAVDFPFFGNIFYPYDMQWLTFTSGVASNGNLFGETSFWISKFTELYKRNLPFRELDQVVGNKTTIFQKWLEHPTPDAYWDAMVPSEDQYKRISIPILTITGHYDGDQPGAMEFYRRHMRYGSESARARHYLIVGPWDHAGTRTPKKEVGGLTFGDSSVLDLNALHKAWYEWTMKDGDRPEFLQDRIAYYVVGAGAEEWKYAPSLDRIATETRELYLHSVGGRAQDVFSSGTLAESAPGDEKPDLYTYDPLDTSPAELEQEPSLNYLTDQTATLNLAGRGLVYHSERFSEATEVTGNLELELWMSLDVPDTDFLVTVYEVLPDGTSVQLTSDLKRARYRESMREEKLVESGKIERYVFRTFTFFSRRISKRSRLRLVLTSPNTIQLQKNYNSGGIVTEESGKDARTAHVTVYHDRDHPSVLKIPIVSAEAP